jgi:hypothetical protein
VVNSGGRTIGGRSIGRENGEKVVAGSATDAATGSSGAEDDYDASGMDGAEGSIVPGSMDKREFVAPGGFRASDPGIALVRGDVHDGELSDGDGVVLVEDELQGFVGASRGACGQACGEKHQDAGNPVLCIARTRGGFQADGMPSRALIAGTET